MTNTPSDLARALTGPDWLQRRRAEAAERATATPLPSTEEEIWRYSRIGELDLDSYRPAAGPSPRTPGPGPASTLAGRATVVTVDGWPVRIEGAGGRVQVATVGEADEDVVGAVLGPSPDVFADWSTALSTPIVVRVPKGVVLTEPIVIVHASGDGAAQSAGQLE